MKALRAAAGELLGLFVDDWTFAAGIVLCVAIVAALARTTGNPSWAGPLLFAGLSLNFLASVVKESRRS